MTERKNPMNKNANETAGRTPEEEQNLLNENPEQETAPENETQEEAKGAKKEKKNAALAELQEKYSELNDRFLRVCAEYDNFKRRTQKEKEELSGYTKGLCVKAILEALDNFERALAADCKDPDYKKGMEMIFNQLIDRIHSLGAVEIEALGQPFDPEFHNAISQVEDENFGENTVCQVYQKGYTLDGKVIRHAMVIVANP